MKIKLSRELVVAQEVVGYFLIIVGLSFHIPHILFYLVDFVTYFESKRPGSIFPLQDKPVFPTLPSIWIGVPCILAGIAFIVFARIIRKTFKTE